MSRRHFDTSRRHSTIARRHFATSRSSRIRAGNDPSPAPTSPTAAAHLLLPAARWWWRGKYRQQTVSVPGRAGGHKAAKRSSRCACPATINRSPPERTAHLNFLVPTLLAPSLPLHAPLPMLLPCYHPAFPPFPPFPPSTPSSHPLSQQPSLICRTTLFRSLRAPMPLPALLPSPHTPPCPLTSVSPRLHPLRPTLSCLRWQSSCFARAGSVGAAWGRLAGVVGQQRLLHRAGRRMRRSQATSSPWYVRHVSAAPAHVSAAPAHASAAPAHVGAFRVLSARLPGACQQRVQVLAMPQGWDAPSTSQASLSSPQYIAPSVVLPRLPSLSLS
ncbi:unnamed protein product [Closterium sp. NIES-65]|nr:unnamed protein product [Closterium sp. NIES-65]